MPSLARQVRIILTPFSVQHPFSYLFHRHRVKSQYRGRHHIADRDHAGGLRVQLHPLDQVAQRLQSGRVQPERLVSCHPGTPIKNGALMICWVANHLAYADMALCKPPLPWTGHAAVVHACKDPCFRSKTIQSVPPWIEDSTELWLNMIDPPRPLFVLPLFTRFLVFADRHVHDRAVIIHCNQGLSRSATLALLWLAKRTGDIPNTSFESAAEAFAAKFPYRPGRGIVTYLSKMWREIK